MNTNYSTLDFPASSTDPVPVTFQIFGDLGCPLMVSVPQTRGPLQVFEFTGTLPHHTEFCLNFPLRVELRKEGEDGFIAENDSLSIIGYGKTGPDAFSDFLESLGSYWKGLKDHPDHELTRDAIKLRDRLELWFAPTPTCDA